LPPEQVRIRKEQGLIIACTAVFIALFVINYVDYIKSLQEYKYIEYDIDTITAGDYTIEFEIEPDFFKNFKEQKKKDWEKKCAEYDRIFKSDVQSFRGWIENEMEERLLEAPDYFNENHQQVE
jgi:hypothetical protein